MRIKKITINILNLTIKTISIFILSIFFIVVISPTGLFLRLFKKDLLNYKFNKDKSYWIKKSNLKNDMKKQF